MRIIGHRGAAGLALENTLESFRLARELKVDGIELDVRVTKDGKVVVCHDSTLMRISTDAPQQAIKTLTYAELRKVTLLNGEHVPLLSEVLQAIGTMPVIVEIKVSGHTETICKVLDAFPGLSITIASFRKEVIAEVRQLRPHIPILLAENRHGLGVLHSARRMRVGIDLNHRLLNPITYWVMNRADLPIMIYTVDNPAVAWFIRTFYPRVWLCTNHPERFIKMPSIETVPED